MPTYPEGVDISNNQGAVDLAAVKASGRSFVFMKSTEGVAFRDSYFAGWWREAKALGLYRGAYHFARPSRNGPEDEAAFFVAIVSEQGIEPGDMLALDLEDPDAGGALDDWTLRFLERVESLAGFAPLIYTSPGYVVDHLLNRSPEIGRFPLWVASWGVSTPPQAPPPWDFASFHQWGVGGPGSVPGVNGECDLNRFNGLLERIPLLGKPGTTAPPAPLPPLDDSISVVTLMAQVDALKEQVATLCQERDGLLSAVAYLGDSGADALTALAKEWQRVRVEQVGPRP
jgi:lysozyme